MSARAAGTRQSADVRLEQLDVRIADALAVARRLLGPEGRGERNGLGHAIVELVARLEAEAPELGEAAAQEAHDAQLRRLRGRFADRAGALERADRAVRRLREITSPAAMLERAPAELSASAELRRVVLSVVHGRVMTAEAVHVRGDEAASRTLLAALRARPLLLEHPLIEAEVLRRRRATVVAHAQEQPRVDRRMAETMGWHSYVVAPVAIRSRVIAVVHADGPEQPLDTLRRDVVWAFASGLAQAYESASLRRTLRREREEARRFLEWLDARSGALSDAAIELVPRELPPSAARDAGGPASGPTVHDDGAALAGLLTRRELEVLRLLARGHTNRAIADELVISGGTVKFHVNSILRRLRVANRAEAVARYYALRGLAAHDDD